MDLWKLNEIRYWRVEEEKGEEECNYVFCLGFSIDIFSRVDIPPFVDFNQCSFYHTFA